MVFVDFDGTITLKDTCDALMDKYADKRWREIDQNWAMGLISTLQAAKKMFELVKVTEDQIKLFLEEIEIDETFLEFEKNCRKRDWPVYIVSDGYYFFIQAILEKFHIAHIPFYSNKLLINGDILDIQCPYFHPDFQMQGVPKARIIKLLMSSDYQSVYIGDGASDTYPAGEVDILFAKKTLEQYCIQKGIDYYPFSSFRDVGKVLFSRDWMSG